MLNQRNTKMSPLDRGTTGHTITVTEAQAHMSDMLNDPAVLDRLGKAVFYAVGDTGANEDIVMDACVKILTYAETYDWTKGDFMGWACSIASNLGRNFRKAFANNGHDSETNIGDENGDVITDLTDTLIGGDGRNDVMRANEAQWLAAAIATLDSDAQAFLGAMADGMGQTEAGALVGWSPATSTRRYRAIVETLAAQA